MKIKKRLWLWAAILVTACCGCVRFRPDNSPGAGESEAGKQEQILDTEPERRAETETEPEKQTAAETEPGQDTEDENAARQEGEAGTVSEETIEEYIRSMTLEDKAAQLFIVMPESLIDGVSCVTAAGDMTREAINEIPVGGFIYARANLRSEDQVSAMTKNVQIYSMERMNLPMFLCIDEEGGTVARITKNDRFQVPYIGDMSDIGKTGDAETAYDTGRTMGTYLSRMGFNVDFAPVADVLSNPDNQVVKRRSFGSDPQLVSDMCLALARGLREQGILSVYKHFPGHGGTAEDTHEGYACTDKTLEELRICDLIPFQEGIRQGVPMIMAGHVSLPGIAGDNTPASLSPAILHDLLREEMGYEGIIITDAMDMGAVTKQYSAAEAAVRSLQAGADMILMPADLKEAYYGVIQAVRDGELTMERIDQSLRRIIRVKLQMGAEGRDRN